MDNKMLPESAHRLAMQARRRGDIEEALRLFAFARASHNEDVATSASHNMGQLFRQAGRPLEAEQAFEAASLSANDDVSSAASLNLAVLLEQRNNMDAAEGYYETASHSGNEDIATASFRALGRIHISKGKTRQALSCLRRAADAANPDLAALAQQDLERALGTLSGPDQQTVRRVPCRNGHIVVDPASEMGSYCPRCGSLLYARCGQCSGAVEATDEAWAQEHLFCKRCSSPYPWTPPDLLVPYLRTRIEEQELSDEDHEEAFDLLAVLSTEAEQTNSPQELIARRRLGELVPGVWRFLQPIAQEYAKRQLGL